MLSVLFRPRRPPSQILRADLLVPVVEVVLNSFDQLAEVGKVRVIDLSEGVACVGLAAHQRSPAELAFDAVWYSYIAV